MPRQVTNPQYYLSSASTLGNAGSGFNVGDTVRLVGGTFTVQAVITVNSVSSGGILTFTATNAGNYSVLPTNPVSLQAITGSGINATMNARWVAGNPGFTAIQHYGSSISGVTPPAGSLEERELFINIPNQKLYVGSSTNQPVLLTGTLASQDSNNVNITGGRINLPFFASVDTWDVTTKNYVDNRSGTRNFLSPVRLASSVNQATLAGLPIIDGVQTLVGDRILLTGQTNQAENGIYNITNDASNTWFRSADANTPTELTSAVVFVQAGNVNAGRTYLQTATITTIGTDPIVWVFLSNIVPVPIDPTTGLFYNGTGALSFVPPGPIQNQNAVLQAVPNGAVTQWQSVRGIATPVADTDFANKAYVDSVASGVVPKQLVVAGTTDDLVGYTYNNGAGGVGATLTGLVNTPLILDGVSINTVGQRVLIKDEGLNSLTNATVVNAGTGYALNDTVGINGGVLGAGGIQATVRIVAMSGGLVTGVNVLQPGLYQTAPTSPATTTAITGTGTGLTLNLTFGNTTFRNGIYSVTQVSTASLPMILTRTADMNAWDEVFGALVNIESGTTQAGTSWIANVPSTGTMGTTGITFVNFGGVSNTLPVGKGGTGLTAVPAGQILFGNDSVVLATDANLVWNRAQGRLGLGTVNPSALLHVQGLTRIQQAMEGFVASTAALTGVNVFNIINGAVVYYTANATGNFTFNFTYDSTAAPAVTLNSILPIGHSLTVVALTTQGTTAYYVNAALQVDGTTTGVTTRWQGVTAPSFGSPSGIDSYVFTILKTADVTFTILASRTQFGG